VVPAVAYRVDAPQGAVVISGDTRVCAEVEAMSQGADVLVHEAFRAGFLAGTPAERVADYHADTAEIGPMAARSGVPTLVLTHLIPPPGLAPDPELAREAFRAEIEAGGYRGRIVVGQDLTRISVGS
jgi:ribonuclease Z